MNKSTRVRTLGLALVMVAALLLSGSVALAEGDAAKYAVSLENLTQTQPFSPPIYVAHAPGYNLFRLGTFASDAIRLIAETGDNSVATAEAQGSPLTIDVVAHDALILPGGSTSVELTAPVGARLSLAAMLGITNDAFTGASALRLPVNGSVTLYLNALDAGTEANNELVGYVGALGGGNMRAPTRFPIAQHPGILGIGDMNPDQYGWQEPVARLTIMRID
jgi:hypothetical protein